MSTDSIAVVHIREYPAAIYIGRAMDGHAESPLRNPYKLETESNRKEIVALYQRDLRAAWVAVMNGSGTQHQHAVVAELVRLVALFIRDGHLVLGCHCRGRATPDRLCHGLIVRDAIIGIRSKWRVAPAKEWPCLTT